MLKRHTRLAILGAALVAAFSFAAAQAAPDHDHGRHRGHGKHGHKHAKGGGCDYDYRGDRHRGDYGRYDRYDRYDRHDRYDGYRYDRRSRFVIPRRIHRDHAYRYDDYYWKRSYHRAHRHHHQVYRFPVYVDRRWSYEPYAYCGGELYHGGRIDYHGRRFSISLGY